MRSQLWQNFWKNLKVTLPAALTFAVLGYVISFPLGYVFDYDAARMKWIMLPPLPVLVKPEQITALGQFQARVIVGSAALGIVVGQTIFVVDALGDRTQN